LTNTRSLEVVHNLLGDLSDESWIQLTSCIRAFESMINSILDRGVLLIYAIGPDSIRVAAWPGAAIVVRLGLLSILIPTKVEAVSSRLHRTVAVSRCHPEQRHLLVTMYCVHVADILIEFQRAVIQVAVVTLRVERVMMKQRLSALSGADTAMRCDASAGAMSRGIWRRSTEKSTRKELALNAAQSSEEKKDALFLCFGYSSLVDRLLGSLDGGSRQGGHDFLGVLDEPTVVIDMET